MKVPNCVGIIMDGNRRWAREKGLSQLEGHRIGLVDTLKNTVRFVGEKKIPHLVVYMFSTENWNRDPFEVSYLMELFRESIKKEMKLLGEEGVRIKFVGQRERFSPDLQEAMMEVEEETKDNTFVTLWACLSYGGRAEIAHAAKVLMQTGEEITEESINRSLWTSGMPDPDIIIRTGGEQRLSGFLLWQSMYSELFFIPTKWPDFSKEVFESILSEYDMRDRRMGK